MIVILDGLDAQTSVFSPFRALGDAFSAHAKSQNALKMGRFGTKNVSKMGQKCIGGGLNITGDDFFCCGF